MAIHIYEVAELKKFYKWNRRGEKGPFSYRKICFTRWRHIEGGKAGVQRKGISA